MNLKQLPPVGTKIPEFDPNILGIKLTGIVTGSALTQSGTCALAIALSIAREASGMKKPEVIIPAYCCPDLVSAAEYAGCQPVVVDIQPFPYGYCADSLSQSVNDNTCAIVLPTLLGIRMDSTIIHEQIPDNVLIVEDNAQWLPESKSAYPEEHNARLHFDHTFKHIDLSIVSFGRGKPVNLLGGGAIFIHNARLVSLLERTLESTLIKQCENLIQLGDEVPSLRFRVKNALFRALCNEWLFGLLVKAPFLHIGETHYHPLTELLPVGTDTKVMLGSGINAYMRDNRFAETTLRSAKLSCLFAQQTDNRLLRYPIFTKSPEARESVYSALNHCGMGASKFYNALVYQIEGVEQRVKRYSSIRVSNQFAEQMLTLPTHSFVTQRHIAEQLKLLNRLDNDLGLKVQD